MANRNIKAGKAKTKLMMDSKQESLDESKKSKKNQFGKFIVDAANTVYSERYKL